MADGTLTELGENSIFQVDVNKDVSLNFMEGSVIVRTATEDRIITRDEEGAMQSEVLPLSRTSEWVPIGALASKESTV